MSEDLVLCLVLVLLIRLSGPLFSFRNHPVLAPFFLVDALYLDSLIGVSTLDGLDPIGAFVQETVLLEDRWPLSFSSLPSCLPLLWSVWCSSFSHALRNRTPRLAVLSSAAFVLSCRCLRLRPMLEAMDTCAVTAESTSEILV